MAEQRKPTDPVIRRNGIGYSVQFEAAPHTHVEAWTKLDGEFNIAWPARNAASVDRCTAEGGCEVITKFFGERKLNAVIDEDCEVWIYADDTPVMRIDPETVHTLQAWEIVRELIDSYYARGGERG